MIQCAYNYKTLSYFVHAERGISATLTVTANSVTMVKPVCGSYTSLTNQSPLAQKGDWFARLRLYLACLISATMIP